MLKHKILSFGNLGLLFILLSLSSCLKERVGNFNTDNAVSHIIDFKNTGANMAGPSSFYPGFMGDVGSVNPGASGYFYINLQYAGAGNTNQDIVVNLAVDQAVLDRYNEENNTDYVLPPADVFSIPAKVTIKGGTNVVTDSVKITRTADYNFDLAYALPIKITSVSTNDVISANFGAAVFPVNIRNLYDGVYSITSGTIQRYSNPTTPTTGDALNGSLVGNPNVTLTTVGANTVEIGNMNWASRGGGIAGIDHLQATVDPLTNKVTMKALGNATLANIAGATNSYDPATKTFTLNYDWNQTSTKREVKNLVIKYVGAR
ncbi:MAG TPA: DUF1735 domain-containing protein [Niabella sp.]